MKNIFITKLILKNVRNLDYIEIPLSTNEKKHLIFTGKNGSGKTTILDGLSEYFNDITATGELKRANLNLLSAKSILEIGKKLKEDKPEIVKREKSVKQAKQNVQNIKRGFEIELNCAGEELHSAFEAGAFVIAYYRAERVFETVIPRHVEKVELQQNYTIHDTPRQNFVKYLLDLKMTQALALSGNKKDKAENIQEWFDKFEKLMQEIFENAQLKLEFDEETFRFYIKEPKKSLTILICFPADMLRFWILLQTL